VYRPLEGLGLALTLCALTPLEPSPRAGALVALLRRTFAAAGTAAR